MNKLKAVCFIILTPALAFSQAFGPPGGVDPGTDLKVGYAVVTPVTTTLGSMTVQQSFGYKAGEEINQTALPPPELTTSAVLFVNTSVRLSRNVGVAIANPNNAPASVTMTLRDANGLQLGTTVVQVAAHQQTSRFITEYFSATPSLPSEITGSLTLASLNPISVVALRFRGSNFNTLPVTNITPAGPLPIIAINVGGAGAFLLPQFVANQGWATEIVLANRNSSSLLARVDIFDSDGALSVSLNGQTASSFINLTIPARGVFKLSPRNSSGDDDF